MIEVTDLEIKRDEIPAIDGWFALYCERSTRNGVEGFYWGSDGSYIHPTKAKAEEDAKDMVGRCESVVAYAVARVSGKS